MADRLTPSRDRLSRLRALERSYLETDDPIRQSGYGGGAARWRAERAPILEAVESDGDFLDVGCANGYLAECLSLWARERENNPVELVPYGVDIGAELVALARARLPELASHFFVADALAWEPPRRFRYVYTLLDLAPRAGREDYLRRLLRLFVAPGGRLIVGDYGSHSRRIPAQSVDEILDAFGLAPAGSCAARSLQPTRFAWVDREG